MPGPHPAVAAVRLAVREVLAELGRGDLVLVACSGGADSLALADAAVFEARSLALRVGAVVVDHGLQPGSEAVVLRTHDQLRGLGMDPVLVRRVVVSGPGGAEAAAREARYAAVAEVAAELGCAAVLLGHTLDDQAEQVLLGLARGAGARSLSGMPPARGLLRRPLLAVGRAQTRAACEAEGLRWWDDPMNEDRAFARVRARAALALLETDLGPGLARALARSAAQLRVDADHLDTETDVAVAELGAGPWDAATLAALPPALRTRVWRRLLVGAGSPPGQVSTRHTDACDALLTRWHGQGPVHAPGPVLVTRQGGRVTLEPAPCGSMGWPATPT